MNEGFTIPKFELPGFISALGRKLPQWPHALALVGGLNAALKLNLLSADDLEALTDKTFRIEVRDTGGTARFTYRNGLFRPIFSHTDTADLSFSANLSAYLQLLNRQEDPDTLFFKRELEITGDTELGLLVKNMLDAIELPKFSLGMLKPKS